MNKQQMIRTVEMCWAVACEADLPGTSPMSTGQTDQYGALLNNSVRLQLFQQLLQTQIAPTQRSEVTYRTIKPEPEFPTARDDYDPDA